MVRMRLTVPGAELVAGQQDEQELSQEVQEMFDVIRRRLEDYARIKRRK
jgi:hypothetical protein